jgi:peptidoglycan/xylan/chitin deacetylase (PgdA/CDA1 family)
MNRREFIRLIALETLVLGMGNPESLFSAEAAPQVAITIDDPHTYSTPLMSPQERNSAILQSLAEHSDLKGALFVCGEKVDSNLGRKMLDAWDKQGHLLGNHSYSHFNLNSPRITSEKYIKDVLLGEEIIEDFLHFTRLFRFPFLKEGDTKVKRDAVRAFLKERGYGIGHVTIDTSDWYVDQRLRERLEKEPDADLTPYRDFYLSHIWERVEYYDDLSLKVLGHSVKHTLLIHHTLLNALFLGDLLDLFESKDWDLIDAQDAFSDPVFNRWPDIVPAGESILWALARESERFEGLLRYPGEDSRYEEEKMDELGL